jgi:hypothetical protein
MSVMIHGKEYVTVAERLQMAKEDIKSVMTEIVSSNPIIVIKATVTTKKGIFTGISGANPSKTIEKQSPYEVAETSAVGRALGFAGYGVIESIATADEMKKADPTDNWEQDMRSEVRIITKEPEEVNAIDMCPIHKVKMSKFTQGTQSWYSHTSEGKWCAGKGYKLPKSK